MYELTKKDCGREQNSRNRGKRNRVEESKKSEKIDKEFKDKFDLYQYKDQKIMKAKWKVGNLLLRIIKFLSRNLNIPRIAMAIYILRQWSSIELLDHGWRLPWNYSIQ